MPNFFKKSGPLLLAFSFFAYTLLSWILFFRDERALVVFEKYYPFAANFLSGSRVWLLHHNLNTIPTLLFIIVGVAAFVGYLSSIFKNFSVKKIIFLSIMFQIIVFFSYPILSTDIFDYINSDRLSVVYNQNVWQVTPDKFPQDKFFPLSDYTNVVRIYGPVNQFFYSAVTRISGDDVFVNLAVHKLLTVIFSILTMFIAWKILSKFHPENLKLGLMLLFWNPLFVIEIAGSGHNDILMVFFVLSSLLLFSSKKFMLSGILLALSIQIKTPPLLFLPFVGAFFLKRKMWREGMFFFISLLLTLFLTFKTMETSLSEIIARQAVTTGSNWQSLPLIIQRYLPVLSPLLKIGLAVMLFVQFIRALKENNPWKIYAQTLFVYLIVFNATLWNWYPIWVLSLLPFLPFNRFSKAVIGFTFGTLLAYGVLWIGLRLNSQNPIFQFIMYGTIVLSTISALIYVQFAKNKN